jgi:hypothetical protein
MRMMGATQRSADASSEGCEATVGPSACATVVAVIASISVAGCFHDAAVANVRSRHAAQFHCDEDRVDVVDVNGTTFRASGCGTSMIYVCDLGKVLVCVADSSPEKEPPPKAPPKQVYRHMQRAPVAFDVPRELERGVDSWHFTDAKDRIAVELIFDPYEGDASTWVEAKYPGAKTQAKSVGDHEFLYAWSETRTTRRWSIVSVDGASAYELWCSASRGDAEGERLCAAVLKSFRFESSGE